MKKILIFGLFVLALISCNSNKEKEGNEKSQVNNKETITPGSGDFNISYNADGKLVKTKGWIVQRFLWDEKTPAPWLNIVSNMHMDKRTINVNLNGTVAGNYILSETGMMKNSHGMYTPDYNKIMDSYSFTSGEFNLTEVDTVKNIISGTFFGVAKNNDGKTITITDGKLVNVKLNPGVNNLSAELDKLK